jgi:hypothetical protein
MSDNIFGNRGNVSYAFGELELQNSTLFRSNFVRSRALGEGGDGMVFAYRHKRSNVSIAVKTAHDGSRHCIIAEIEALKKIGSHENLAPSSSSCATWAIWSIIRTSCARSRERRPACKSVCQKSRSSS